MRVPQPKVSKREIRKAADQAAEDLFNGITRWSVFEHFVRTVFFPDNPRVEWDTLHRVEKSYHDVIALEVSQALVRLATKKVTARAARLAKKREANRRYRIKRGLPVTTPPEKRVEVAV